MAAGSTQRVYAEAFLAALAKRDYGAIASSLHPNVAFRALLPSRVAEHGVRRPRSTRYAAGSKR
jgi:hypothetical protein